MDGCGARDLPLALCPATARCRIPRTRWGWSIDPLVLSSGAAVPPGRRGSLGRRPRCWRNRLGGAMHVRSLTYRCSIETPSPGRPDRASHFEPPGPAGEGPSSKCRRRGIAGVAPRGKQFTQPVVVRLSRLPLCRAPCTCTGSCASHCFQTRRASEYVRPCYELDD